MNPRAPKLYTRCTANISLLMTISKSYSARLVGEVEQVVYLNCTFKNCNVPLLNNKKSKTFKIVRFFEYLFWFFKLSIFFITRKKKVPRTIIYDKLIVLSHYCIFSTGMTWTSINHKTIIFEYMSKKKKNHPYVEIFNFTNHFFFCSVERKPVKMAHEKYLVSETTNDYAGTIPFKFY